MNIVVLTNDSPNQWELCHKLQQCCNVAGIVVSKNALKSKGFQHRLRQTIRRIEGRLLGRRFVKAWTEMLAACRSRFQSFPNVPLTVVSNINDDETLSAIRGAGPDLVVVSGTNLLKDPLIRAIKEVAPLINLHTGISPYVKGGPNCTNWCLAMNSLELIGNSVMWLDEGIDTGDLIATEQTPLDGSEDLDTLHIKVMHHAHSLLCRAVEALAKGGTLQAIPQGDIGRGQTFFNRQWNGTEMRRGLRNFDNHFASIREIQSKRPVRLAPLTPR